jgi:hypothetical protein
LSRTDKLRKSKRIPSIPSSILVKAVDSTNSAFRLANIANKDLPSQIVICSNTADVVRGVLPVADLGLVSLRGRTGQEHVYGIGRHGKFTERKLAADPSLAGTRVSTAGFPGMIH